jgi:serine protease Do
MSSSFKLLAVAVALGIGLTAVGAVVCEAGEKDQPASVANVLALEEAIVGAAESALDSVVSIEAQVPFEAMMGGMPPGMPPGLFDNPFFHWEGPSPQGEEQEEEFETLVPAGGSGVVYSADGYIVTNNHVVEDAVELRVVLHDGRTFPAEVVGTDPESDLAVIKIDAEGLKPARYADIDRVKPGQFAVAVGMPLGHEYSVTVGHISALGRGLDLRGLGFQGGSAKKMTIQNFIQTDTSINPGNSGGPLLNLHGEVMGINNMVQEGVGGGFGFAIPSDLVQKVTEQLIETGSVSRAWLGVSMTDLTYEKAQALEIDRNAGALVEEVFDGSPAAAAGIERLDVIVAVGDEEVGSSQEVVYRVSSHLAGEEVGISVVRKGKLKTFTMVSGDRKDGLAASADGPGAQVEEPEEAEDAGSARYGMRLKTPDAEANRALGRSDGAGGVLVDSVVRSSPAQRAGIGAGDVILDVDGKAATSPAQVARLLIKSKKDYIPLTIETGGRQRFVALKKVADSE